MGCSEDSVVHIVWETFARATHRTSISDWVMADVMVASVDRFISIKKFDKMCQISTYSYVHISLMKKMDGKLGVDS